MRYRGSMGIESCSRDPGRNIKQSNNRSELVQCVNYFVS